MSGYDAIIIGGGPAGLTAGLYLARARRRVILLEKETFGGPVINYERIENYPGFSEGVSGCELVTQMAEQAANAGLQMEMGEVVEVENFTSCRSVVCSDGTTYTAPIVIIAGGAHPKSMNVPGEDRLKGKGIIHCAFCDGGQFVDKVVAVCGGGDAGISGALYLAQLCTKVYVLEFMPKLNASAILQERAAANPKIEIMTATTVVSIVGENSVEGIEISRAGAEKTVLPVDGVLVHVGVQANTDYLEGLLTLDEQGRIKVNQRMETEVPYILAAGDIRGGSPNQVVIAAGDGAIAGITAERLLQQL
ncbi:MAG TPA: FAD-dependent oxidoreductase [Anaerolineae bacterium]|nr:FAD-dependent oxidoreductase [Anaerolineae bacterium]HOQ98052.1 FAD-dependent oxidoreductase [Anaerolineae bacterium]